jgi:hypothetical protein
MVLEFGMTLRLSDELQQAIADQGDRPMRVVHPRTHKVYVLVTAETFDRLKPLLDDDFEVRETYAAQDAALAKVWDDPELDAYADYDRHRPQP